MPPTGAGLLGELDQEHRPLARHEHPPVDGDPQPPELDPPEHVLQRRPGDPVGDQPLEVGHVAGGVLEQGGLLLGVHAPRRAEPFDEGHVRQSRNAPTRR